MKPKIRLLRALIEDGMYPIDERVLADAILARASIRGLVPGVEFAPPRSPVRSFRVEPSARSFRLAQSPRRSFH